MQIKKKIKNINFYLSYISSKIWIKLFIDLYFVVVYIFITIFKCLLAHVVLDFFLKLLIRQMGLLQIEKCKNVCL